MGFVNFLSFLFASGLGFGLSFWIYGTLLQKSNSIGDSTGSKYDYDVHVNFTVKKDRMSNNEKNSFSSTYAKRIDEAAGPRGTEQVRRMSDEEIEKYKQMAEAAQSGSRVSSPGAANASGKIMDSEAEFREWEKNNSQNPAPQSPFKPLS